MLVKGQQSAMLHEIMTHHSHAHEHHEHAAVQLLLRMGAAVDVIRSRLIGAPACSQTKDAAC